nr:glycosyltransferase [Puniceicoccus vermicola]
MRKSWGAPPDSPVFLTVGRVASEKNMQLLFRAWEKIRTQRPDARLVIVGDGPERKALEKAWPDALFAGARRGDDLAAHYASADFFLFPSITETFGNVVTEALASGLVVLAFDYAAPGKFIQHEENGFIVPFKNEEAFLTVADCLTPSDQDWSAMREAARETGLQLSWEAVLERFVKDLREAIAQQKADGLQQI